MGKMGQNQKEEKEPDYRVFTIQCKLSDDEITLLNFLCYSIYDQRTSNNYKVVAKGRGQYYGGDFIEICPFKGFENSLCPNCWACKFNIVGEEN